MKSFFLGSLRSRIHLYLPIMNILNSAVSHHFHCYHPDPSSSCTLFLALPSIVFSQHSLSLLQRSLKIYARSYHSSSTDQWIPFLPENDGHYRGLQGWHCLHFLYLSVLVTHCSLPSHPVKVCAAYLFLEQVIYALTLQCLC